ncbi:metallophosphoesterase [Anaerostipes sp.]|uniref:metallophosphoesterase n=1 Tax=Anaerostipes sp. TaxID=1872530 RepID=UPI0025BD0820|nr:metallophosphoesterase [Anaerostipes sp.]MBS7009577.1 metallophosphoesterase [Anaerostipes sp.]
MQIILILLAFGVFIGLFVNAGLKLFLWFRPFFAGASPLIFGILYGVIVTAIMVLFVLSRLPDSRIPRGVFLADHYALGAALFVMLFVNLGDLVLFVLKLCHILPAPLPQGAAAAAGITALALSVLFSVYGGVHALTVRTINYEIKLQEDKAKADSMKIALISDLHLGYVIEEKHIEKIVAAVNESEPDLVCIAGDIFDGDITSVKNPEKLQKLFQKIEAPYGVYACLGNHDAGAGYEGMLKFLDKAGVRLLQDESVLIGNKIILAGRKDSGPIGGQGEKRKALKEADQTEKFPRIVLDHKPENIEEYGRSTDLILCGHTHRGQIFPFNLVTGLFEKFNYGYYRPKEDGPQAVVTSGAGTWGPPHRIGTDNEVAVIQVTFPVMDEESPE